MSFSISTLMASQSYRNTLNDTDNTWQGDEIIPDKSDDITRIMFHNVNGLPMSGTEGFDLFIQDQHSLQVDVQAISEHCLDTTKFQVIHSASEILRHQHRGQAILQLDSSSEPAVNRYKPGGTGLVLLGPITGRLEPQGRGGDSMGRWSFVHLRRKHLSPITIISAYQVCPRPTNVVGNTAYHQQQRALNLAGRDNIHPRKAFIADLNTFITTLRNQNHDIILGGDFNEALTDKNSGIHQLATRQNLTDPFLYRFPHQTTFGTHVQGHRRIDIVLMSPRLIASLHRIGYAPFHFSSTTSDHRPVLIDLKTKRLFGETFDDIQPARNRGVHSKDKKAVQMFITNMFREIQQRGGFTHQQEIDDDMATSNTVEIVDEIIGVCGTIAENKCRKRRPEFYSQPVVQYRIRVSILRGHLNALKIGRDRTPQLHRRMRRAGIHVDLPETQQLTRLALNEARGHLQEILDANLSLRQQELEHKLEHALSQGEKQRSKILRAIKKVELGRQTYRILKAMRRPAGSTQTIDRVEIPATWPPPNTEAPPLHQLEDPKTCVAWRMVTNPTEIEYYLMMRNRLHFGQAEGTPFTCLPLRADIDWTAATTTSDEILQGTYRSTSNIPQCRDLLEACKAATELDSLPPEMTMSDFKGKITSWQEATTTSPSGRHLGRYKALFARGPLEYPADGEHESSLLADKQDKIAQLILSVINYCIRNNYVLNRWKTIVNVMILKEAMNYKIHRLRVIHIYEADFNMILAVKWRQLLRSADSKNLINEGQYGGRPGCEAQALTLLEELKYDLSYLSRRTLFNFDNDATSCYDRILVPLASLINRKYGLHQKIVAVHATTLQQAQFRLKTAPGISTLTYSHCDQYPIHGTGQGSGNSPCIWLFISSTLFDIHEQKSQGVTFVSPDGKQSVRMSMVGFVDDSTGSCNNFQPGSQASLPDMVKMMESDAQLWNNLLYCTGGKLELSKCSFHVLHFDFRANGTPVPSLERFENQIHVTDLESNNTIPIQSKRAIETHKTLGHQKSPHSAPKTTLHELRDKANHLSLLISISPISRQGAYMAYQTVVLPTIKYTLPQSFYPRKLLEQTQAQSLGRIIAKCGFNRNTARPVMFAPTSYAGGGFIPWHVLQGEGQIQHVLKHWRTNTIVSETLRIAVHWAQWQSGHGTPIFQDTHTALPYLECRWLKSTRSFLSSIEATIEFDTTFVAPIERRNDIYIMEYARTCGLFNDQDLAIINYCRLYLHATTVSELFSEDGKHILSSAFRCVREPWFNQHTYITLQQRPSDYQIRTKWQRLCRQWSTSAGHIAASLVLGPWTTSGHLLRRRRQTYITHATPRKLYHWQEGKYWEYARTKDHQIFTKASSTDWEPLEACTPVTAQVMSEDKLTIHCPKIRAPSLDQIRAARTFEHYIASLKEWERDLLHGIHFHMAPYELYQYIVTLPGKTALYMVSDGSQRGDELHYGWVYGTEHGTTLAEHSGSGYGTPTSHRAEGWAMLSGTLFIHHLFKYLNVSRPPSMVINPLVFYCDNAGLVQRINQRKQYQTSYPNSTLETDWDLVEQIFLACSTIPHSNITHAWVRGHQDDQTFELSVEAKYNIRADQLASQTSLSCRHHKFPKWLLPAERCRLVIAGTPIYGNYTHAIRTAATLPPYFEYLRKRHGWTKTIQSTIDWKLFQTAAKTSMLPLTQLVKLVHGKLPTRYELAKSNSYQAHTCHYCSTPETFAHLLKCTRPLAQQFRDDLLEQMDTYFERQLTPTMFRQTFILGLQFWLEPTTPNNVHRTNVPACFQAQETIGWDLLPRGFISTAWRSLYEHSSSLDSAIAGGPTSDLFLSGLVKLLWQLQLQYWNTYTSASNSSAASNQSAITDKRQELIIRVRSLHQKREFCLHGHRDQYFHDDVEHFLTSATITQMRSYIHHYDNAITQSVKAAQQLQTRPLTRFPGFLYQPKSRLRPPLLSTVPPQTKETNSHTGNRGVPISRKHTRWRSLSSSIKSIRDFFLHPPAAT